MKRHDSQRGWFAYELYKHILKDKNIWLVVGDLGYKVWDQVRKDRPKQFINVGAAEQSMMDIAVGLALSGKKPVVYTITPFLLYRPFETIRTYIDYEKINVKLIGSGRDTDYAHDGWSHHSTDDRQFMKPFKNIKSIWPDEKEEIPALVQEIITADYPIYLNLKR